MRCIVCKQKEASTKKIVQVDTKSPDPRQPLQIMQVDVCDDCMKKVENGEYTVKIVPKP